MLLLKFGHVRGQVLREAVENWLAVDLIDGVNYRSRQAGKMAGKIQEVVRKLAELSVCERSCRPQEARIIAKSDRLPCEAFDDFRAVGNGRGEFDGWHGVSVKTEGLARRRAIIGMMCRAVAAHGTKVSSRNSCVRFPTK